MTYLQQLTIPAEPLMTDAQAAQLWRLCLELGSFAAFDPTLGQNRAAREIGALIEEIRLSVLPPHTD